ncbi:MAG: hypothetical protein ABF743_12440 [Schleiferilactobacillus perolens]|jgi:hypothetical protein|uniref:hypothetical protein n=1 Tax=Schleiferilactobacillus perolens TaxID=100468 RepID=UPI0039EC1DD8
MERNVSPANWLYPDRGMVKWLGYFLSDHTQYMENEKTEEQTVAEEDQQSPNLIANLLDSAWQQHQTISLQLNELRNGRHAPDLVGVIVGYDAGFVYCQENNDQLRVIPVQTIRHIQSLKAEKWWDRA